MAINAPWIKYLPWLLIWAACIYVWSTMLVTPENNSKDLERTIIHSWKEEVLLQNNHVILVQRHQNIHIKPVKDSYDEVTIHEMSLEVISRNGINPPPKWDYPLAPLVFDYDDSLQSWYVIATWFSEIDLTKVKQRAEWIGVEQHFPYVRFIYRENKWIKKALTAKELIKIPRRNIQPYDDLRQNLLTILEKQRLGNAQYLKLIRKNRKNYFCITDRVEYELGCLSKKYPKKIPYKRPEYYYDNKV